MAYNRGDVTPTPNHWGGYLHREGVEGQTHGFDPINYYHPHPNPYPIPGNPPPTPPLGEDP